MRSVVLAAAIAAAASFAFAAPPPYVIDPLFAAPIDRALENIEQSEMPEDRREALLARLNLLAWSRDDAVFYYRRSDQRIYGWGGAPCPLGPPYHVTPSAPIEPGDLCATGIGSIASWGGGSMPRETPAAPIEAALARLDAARVHYARAVELSPDDLWMRLGYAYTLDQQQRTDEARAQLRAIMQIGRRVLAPNEVQGWEADVLREAADQLEHLAVSRRDRQSLRRLRARMERVEIGPPPMSPIVVPLVDASFDNLVDLASPVGWNFSGQRVAPPRGWLRDNAAWLVWDPNRRAQITSGFDMIGERAWGVLWRDGFEALRALDDNRDGEVSGAELSQSSEVRPLEDHGVVGLAVRGAPTRSGLITAPAGVRFEDGRTRPLYDWTPGESGAPVS